MLQKGKRRAVTLKRQWPTGTCSREGIFKKTCRGSLALHAQLWNNVPFSGGWEGTSHSLTAALPRKQVEEQCSPREGAQGPTVGGDGVKPKPVQELTTEWDMLHGLQARTAPLTASGTPTRTRKAASHLGVDPPSTWES